MKKELNEKILPIYDDLLFLTETLNPEFLKNYLENAQIVLFVYLKSDFNAENKLLLQNLTNACKLNETDVQFLELENLKDLNKLFPHILAKKIVLFGVSLESDIFSTSYIQHHLFEFKGKKLVQTSSLSILAKNQEFKKMLWYNGLKPMFEL